MTIIEALSAPFPADLVSWRVGPTSGDKSKGMALAYIDARDVMKRLDDACGPFGWQSRHELGPDGKKVTCHIGVRNPETGEWIWKSDGAGETDTEGEKGSYSDSLKRAAVAWGIGRYLYDTPSPWVAIEQKGKSYIIKEGEFVKLRQTLQRMPGTAPSIVRPTTSAGGEAPNGAGFITPTTSDADESTALRQKLEGLMAKTVTKSGLRNWADSPKVSAAINGLAEKDRVFFDAEFQKRWTALPETAVMAG